MVGLRKQLYDILVTEREEKYGHLLKDAVKSIKYKHLIYQLAQVEKGREASSYFYIISKYKNKEVTLINKKERESTYPNMSILEIIKFRTSQITKNYDKKR